MTTSKKNTDTKANVELFDFALKASNVGLWEFSGAEQKLFWSDRLKDICGVSYERFEKEQQSLFDRTHPDDKARVGVEMKARHLDPEPFELDFRVIKEDGSTVWLRTRSQIVWNDDGGIERMAGSVIDISEEVRLKRDLAHNERQLQLIFDSVPASIFLINSNSQVVRLNTRAARAAGRPINEVIGLSATEVFPQLAKHYKALDKKVLTTGKPILGVIENFITKSNYSSWIRTDRVPYTDPDTGEKFILVTSVDITALHEAELAMTSYAAKLEEANKELDHFAYIASHDLKAPLRGMDNIAKWIAQDLGDSITPETSKMLDLLTSRVRRMEVLLKDILAYSRAGSLQSDPELIQTEDLIDEAVEWIAPPKGINVIKTNEMPTLTTHATEVYQVFQNLISNAVKHHDRKSGLIEITAKEDGNFFEFVIADDGPGIPEAYQDHVFQIFKTLRSKDEVEGSGIGLAIVKKMIEKIGGRIWIESVQGERGTSFHFTLPTDSNHTKKEDQNS